MPFFPDPERMIFLKHPLQEETSDKHDTPVGNVQVAFHSPCCHHRQDLYQICEDKNSGLCSSNALSAPGALHVLLLLGN